MSRHELQVQQKKKNYLNKVSGHFRVEVIFIVKTDLI